MKIKYKKPYIILLFLTILLSHIQYTVSQQSNQTTPQPTTNQTTQQKSQPKQQQHLDYTPIQLEKPYKQQLNKQQSFTQKYRLNIKQQQVTKLNQSKWYLFIDVQTTQEFQWEKTKIQLFSINSQGNQKPLKQCDTVSGLDSCFLTNNNFDYKKQSIQAKVTCQEYCKFTISAQISAKYKLSHNQSLQLDFQDTAYSKLFSLDTDSLYDFKRLQIILKPKGFLSFNAPIRLYANKGESIPTRQKHDYAGIHLWDDGLGIFINYPDASGQFTILIQGPQKNILVLQTEVIYQSKPIVTTRYQPYFAYLQSQQKQIFQIPIVKTQHTYIKLTTLTGSIQLSKVKDQSLKDLKIQFTPLSRSYGQLQYKFQPSFYQTNKQSNITNKIYIQIKASKDSTFIFQSYTNNDQLNYLVPQVNRYADLQKGGIDLYYMKLYQLAQSVNDKNKVAQLQVMTTTFDYVDLGTKIFMCKGNEAKECQPSKQQITKLNNNQSIDNQIRKQLKNITKDASVPGVRYYDVLVNYNDFVKKDQVYHIFIIIVVTNPKQDQQILYTLQYINLGQTYFMKQKQLKRDRLSIDQIKYYTFINNDKDVKSIKIHSIQISGEILMVGYKQDPRYNNVQGKQIYQYHGSVNFLNVQPGQQFFVMVQGIENAFYSLYLQLIRQSQSTPDQKGGNQGYNQIIIQQNVPYDFFIKPNQNIIIQMHATTPQFELIVGSHLPLELCMTQNLDKPPFKPNCQIKQSLTKNQRMGIKMDKGLIGNIGVTNNNNKSVQFKIQFHPKGKQQQFKQSCPGMLNKFSLQSSNVTQKKVTTYKMNLNRRQNLQILVELDDMLYDNTTITWQLNDKQKQIMMNSRHLIWKKELVKVCTQSQKQRCQLTISIESQYATDGIMLVQYLDKDLILLDGIAQPAITDQKSPEPKHFRYQLINLVNTTIIVENKVGYYHFYGQVIPRNQFMKSQNRSSLYPTQQNHLFKSQNPFYYVYQTYILTQESLKNSTCKQQCVLLISVQISKNDLSGEDNFGRFVIQVSQQDRFLKQNQPVMGYLERGSLAFYQYYNPNPGTIYIQLNNQNMHCSKIFIKKGNQTRATPSSYDQTTEQNSLIFKNAQVGPYSIAVQAKKFGCSYTIQAVSTIVKLQKIKRGIFSDKTLQQNQTYHLLYEHFRNQSFKILTLNKVGQVMIKLKVLYEGELNKLLSANTTQALQEQLANFTYQSSNIDFLKVHHNKDLFFCTNCTYLISITANKYTQTSIIIPSKDVQIPIITNALIKDQVKQKEVMKYRIFTSNIAQYQLYVQYGSINLTIVESITDKVVLSKVYNQTKQPIYEKFNSSSSNNTDGLGYGYDFIHYSIITIQGVANSSFYSFQLLAAQDQKKQGNIKYGIPQYFFLQPNQSKCFKGTIDDDSQQFILSFDDSTLQNVKKLSIECKVNDKKVDYVANYGISQMTIQIKDLKLTEPASFQICLKSTESLSLTFIQSAHIMMVPSDTSILLTKSTNLTFGSKGTTILQVDECQSRSIISVSSTFNDLHTSQSQIQQIHRANNLIQFNHWGPVYVHLQTEGTRLRWRDKNVYKQTGMGYDKFVAGTATAFKQGDNIKVQARPLIQVDKYSSKTNLKINQVSYKIMLARSQRQLLHSLNCQQSDNMKYQHQATSLDNSAIASFPINDQMKSKYSQMKFFFVGVIVNLNIQVNGMVQNYRYVYPMVEIQREVFFGGDIKPKPVEESDIKREESKNNNNQSLTYLLIALGLILLSMISYCVYRKWVWRWLRSRRQKLSDQGSASFKYTQFASMNQ